MSISKTILESIKSIVGKRIMPKVEQLIDQKILPYERHHHRVFQNRFANYLERRYEHFMTMDTLVLQNQQVPFDQLYYPLTLLDHDYWNGEVDIIEFKINAFPVRLFSEYHRLLVVDTAGMGKSTILKKLFLSAIEEKATVPIFIELRKLNKENDILNEIFNQLSPIDREVSQKFILHLITQGDFTFFFDGFDEIPLVDKDFVISKLHEFIQKANNNSFVIASRPEDSLASFSGFQGLHIKSLEREDAHELIRIYAQADGKKNAEDLITILKEDENKSVHEFLNNPLLVSLLYAAFDYGREVPLEKAQFYSLVFDALFHRHDLTKEGYFKRKKYSGLHKDNFEKILRGIGYITFKEGILESNKYELISFIERAKEFYKLEFNPSDFFEDLIRTVPLFQKDGNYYKWSHKSLQDYFAAKFVVSDIGDRKVELLNDYYLKDDNIQHINFFDLVYYLDYKAFRNTIIKSFIQQIVNACDGFTKSHEGAPELLQQIFSETYFEDQFIGSEYQTVLALEQGKIPKKFRDKDSFSEYMLERYNFDRIIFSQSKVKFRVNIEIFYGENIEYTNDRFFFYFLSNKINDFFNVTKEDAYRELNLSKRFCLLLLTRIKDSEQGYVLIPHTNLPDWITPNYYADYLSIVRYTLGKRLKVINIDKCQALLNQIEEEKNTEATNEDFL